MNFKPTKVKFISSLITSAIPSFLLTMFAYPPNIHGFNLEFFRRLFFAFIVLFMPVYVVISLISKKKILEKEYLKTKNKKYYLRGGIIGGIIGASSIIIFFIFISPFILYSFGENPKGKAEIIIEIIRYIIIFFSGGALIGLIVGLILDSRKNKI